MRFSLFPTLLIGITLFFQLATETSAQGENKSSYHLFHAVPDNQLREMAGDRPDGTESPTTVDAGRIQIEMSLIDYARDKSDGVDFEAITAGATNVRIGLLKDLELQVLFDSYTREEVQAGAVSDTVDGFSDVTLRPKYNVWGNDGGSSALAVMPALKIPTDTDLSNGEFEGAIIIPFGMDLTSRLGLGLMAEVDWVYDEESDDYDTEFFHTAVVGIDINDSVGAYVEYIGIAGAGDYQPFFSGGLTLSVTENLVLDAGAVVGLDDSAQDLQVFSGFTVRF